MTVSRRIGVLGIGNVLMGDDGIGPFIVKILEARYEFPPDVILHDLGTPGLGITSFFADYDAVILLDAVSANAPAGEVRLYRKDQLVNIPGPRRSSALFGTRRTMPSRNPVSRHRPQDHRLGLHTFQRSAVRDCVGYLLGACRAAAPWCMPPGSL